MILDVNNSLMMLQKNQIKLCWQGSAHHLKKFRISEKYIWKNGLISDQTHL